MEFVRSSDALALGALGLRVRKNYLTLSCRNLGDSALPTAPTWNRVHRGKAIRANELFDRGFSEADFAADTEMSDVVLAGVSLNGSETDA